MRNTIRTLTIIAISLVLLASCNLDSSEGLIQSAMNAVKTVPYKVTNIIGKSTNALYVSTDKGICILDGQGSFTLKKEGGVAATNTLYADDNGYIIFENGSTEADNKLTHYTWEGTSSPVNSNLTYRGMYSPNGKDFTYLFSTGKDYKKIYIQAGDPVLENLKSASFITLDYPASIIGNNAFVLLEKVDDKTTTNTKYLLNDTEYNTNSKSTKTRTSGAISNGTTRYAVDMSGVLYKDDTKLDSTKLTVSTYQTLVPMYFNTETNDIIYIYPGESVCHKIDKDGNHTRITINALSSSIPNNIIGYDKDSKKYLILNVENGLYTLDLEAKKYSAVTRSNPVDITKFI